MPFDLDLVADHAPHRDRVSAAGVEDADALGFARLVQALVERAHGRRGQIDGHHAIGYVGRRHHTSALLQL